MSRAGFKNTPKGFIGSRGFCRQTYDGLISQLGPAGWWKLNDAVGATTVTDFSLSTKHPGTVVGTVTFGKPSMIGDEGQDTVALFDGNTGYITTTLAPPAGAFTIIAWAYVQTPQGAAPDQFPYIMACDWASQDQGVYLGCGYQASFGPINNMFFGIGTGAGQSETDWYGIQTQGNLAHMFVGVWDGVTNLNLYCDAQFVSTLATATTYSAGPQPWSIGANNAFESGYGDFWPNLIGQVTVLNGTALSLAQITALYNTKTRVL